MQRDATALCACAGAELRPGRFISDLRFSVAWPRDQSAKRDRRGGSRERRRAHRFRRPSNAASTPTRQQCRLEAPISCGLTKNADNAVRYAFCLASCRVDLRRVAMALCACAGAEPRSARFTSDLRFLVVWPRAYLPNGTDAAARANPVWRIASGFPRTLQTHQHDNNTGSQRLLLVGRAKTQQML